MLKPNTQKITIKDGIAKNTLTGEAKNELCKSKQIEKNVVRENLVYKTNEYTYNFQNFLTINTFGRDIYNGTITLKEADKDQSDKLVEILRNKENQKIQKKKKKKKKKMLLETYMHFLKAEKEFFMLLVAKYFE